MNDLFQKQDYSRLTKVTNTIWQMIETIITENINQLFLSPAKKMPATCIYIHLVLKPFTTGRGRLSKIIYATFCSKRLSRVQFIQILYFAQLIFTVQLFNYRIVLSQFYLSFLQWVRKFVFDINVLICISLQYCVSQCLSSNCAQNVFILLYRKN